MASCRWILTLRGIDARGGAVMASRQVESTVHHVLQILRPLMIPSQSAELENTLLGIIKESVTL